MSENLPVGFILDDGNNEYEILDCGSGKGFLGQGGFGITYLAREKRLERDVAIKEFFPSAIVGRDQTLTVTSRDKDQFTSLKKYFLGEARFLAGFDDPSIVKVLAFFEANNTAYLVMPYLQGDTVEDRYKQTAFSEAQAKALFLQVISGLKTVHTNGLLHRDIKPANIKYDTKSDTPILIDFGSARAAGGTGTKSTVGAYSPHFSPIELNSTNTKKTAATDVYALGATIYRTLFQSGPPDAAHRFEQDDDGLPELEAALSEGRISSGLSDVLKRCLELRAKDRFQSLDDLEAALEKKETPSAVIPDAKLSKPVKVEKEPLQEPYKAPLIPPRAPPSKSVSRQPNTILILMLLVGAIGAVLYFGFSNSDPDPVVRTEIISAQQPGLDSLKIEVAVAIAERDLAQAAKNMAQRQTELLNQQVSALREQLGQVQILLDDATENNEIQKFQLKMLGSQLNSALARVAAEERRRRKLE